MSNTHEQAHRWLELILAQSFPGSDLLATQVAAGTIGELCACGCHGFGFVVPQDAQVKSLSKAGLLCEMAFSSNFPEEISILLFTDGRGYFARADVTYGRGNVGAMPEEITAVALLGIWPAGGAAM